MSTNRLTWSARSPVAAYICHACRSKGLVARPTRPLRLSAYSTSTSSTRSRRQLSTSTSRSQRTTEPPDDYYALLLSEPLLTPARSTRVSLSNSPTPTPVSSKSTPPSAPSASSASTPSETPPSDTAPRVVFGSRLLSPEARAERRSARDAASTVVAGVRIPPRPAEPDNCCMSGCANCVWDMYREELEEWAAARREAEGRMEVLSGGDGAEPQVTQTMATSVDDDDGGREARLLGKDDGDVPGEDGELFAGVPVGIREFMRIEKRLAQARKEREVAAAAAVTGAEQAPAKEAGL